MKDFSPKLSRRLLAWYDAHRRDLPWRQPVGDLVNAPPAYHVLVSEAMLQQTQVSTVIPYFHRFIAAFPTLKSLADSDEQAILRLWQGLGYYSRARNLRKAAQLVLERFGGAIPKTVDDLLTLPGVGRYTAGAIASIAYNTPAPILDGNVIRVLCRIDAVRDNPQSLDVRELLWARAAQILPKKRVGDFNSSLMELGATVCTPRNPSCLICPIRSFCRAAELGIQEQIPPPKIRKASPVERRRVFCIRRKDDRYLIEQRPLTGRWAGMWQFKTIVADDEALPDSIDGIALTNTKPLTTIRHTLTHREYIFAIFTATTRSKPTKSQCWKSIAEMESLPFSKPQLKIRTLLSE